MIRLLFPPESLEAIKNMGLRQRSPERLRWTDQHSMSSHGSGVLLRGQSGEILDGHGFRALHEAFGVHIECSTELEMRRVKNALAWPALELPEDTVRLRENRVL